MLTASATAPEAGAEDGAEDGGAERRPEQLAASLAGARDGEPGESSRPGGRARGTWTNRASPSARALPRPRTRSSTHASSCEAGDDRDLRPSACGGEPARDPAESAPAPKAPTSSPAPVFESPNSSASPGTSGARDAEQQRVDEQDHRHENEKPAHKPTLPMENASTVRQRSKTPAIEPKRRPVNQANES